MSSFSVRKEEESDDFEFSVQVVLIRGERKSFQPHRRGGREKIFCIFFEQRNIKKRNFLSESHRRIESEANQIKQLQC